MTNALVFSTSTDKGITLDAVTPAQEQEQARIIAEAQEAYDSYMSDPHCFVCGRHTDHFAEHDDMVEAGTARYGEDGSVYPVPWAWDR